MDGPQVLSRQSCDGFPTPTKDRHLVVQSTDQVWKSPAQVWAHHFRGQSSSRIPAMIVRANAIVELNI